MGDIFTTEAIISGVSIEIIQTAQCAGTRKVIATEARPANFQEADTFLAAHGFRRVRNWDLGDLGTVTARVQMVDNQFGGTRAARLWNAVGTTHQEWETAQAWTVEDGDLISDMEISEPYVVAGSSLELDTMKIHMVGEGQVWAERFTGEFHRNQLVKVARRKR
jgi:Zn-dependent alcohol dehydrogenase